MVKTRMDAWLASQQRAVLSRADLRSLFSRHSLDVALREGVITRVLPGFYVQSARAEEYAVRAEALSRWHPETRIAGTAALTLLGAALPVPGRIAVIIPHRQKPRMPAWAHVRRLTLSDMPVWVGSVRCVPPAVAVVDAWHRAARREDEAIVYRCLWDRIASAADVFNAMEQFARVRDQGRLTRLLQHFEAGATSPLEVMAKTRVFNGQEFRGLEWQAVVVIAGRKRRIDALHREAGVALEFDGRAYHDSVDQWQLDRERDAELAAAGLTTMRFTFEDITRRPDWCRRQLRAAVSARLGHPLGT